MWCSPGTHETAALLISALRIPLVAKIADIGAGSGALLVRLRDLGYSHLSAFDMEPIAPPLDEIPVNICDLNEPFCEGNCGKFDLVTAVEVIEHLESPRAFLRQLRSLVSAQGTLIISTPNIANILGRFEFFINGSLRFFGKKTYLEQRHISVLSLDQLRWALEEAGFTVTTVVTAGSFVKPWIRRLYSPMAAFVRLICGQLASGDVILVVAQASTIPDLNKLRRYRDKYR